MSCNQWVVALVLSFVAVAAPANGQEEWRVPQSACWSFLDECNDRVNPNADSVWCVDIRDKCVGDFVRCDNERTDALDKCSDGFDRRLWRRGDTTKRRVVRRGDLLEKRADIIPGLDGDVRRLRAEIEEPSVAPVEAGGVECQLDEAQELLARWFLAQFNALAGTDEWGQGEEEAASDAIDYLKALVVERELRGCYGPASLAEVGTRLFYAGVIVR